MANPSEKKSRSKNVPKKSQTSEQDKCYIYTLKDKNKTVKYGKTNNPKRRKSELKNDPEIQFTSFKLIEGPMSCKKAEKKEDDYIHNYQKRHDGKPPKYNKRDFKKKNN